MTELSPLDQIRLAEADVARHIVAAREAGEEKVAKVRAHAGQIIYAARDAGRKEGEAHYKDIIIQAEEEARTIIAQAQHRAVELKRQGRQRMESLTSIAIDMVIGWKGAPRSNEH